MENKVEVKTKLTAKDFASDQDVLKRMLFGFLVSDVLAVFLTTWIHMVFMAFTAERRFLQPE